VGYDDYSDLRLSGAQTAAPIWAEFMKKAVALPAYADVKPFTQPEGVVDVQLDKITNRLATPACPDDYTIAFVAGTEPHDTCDQTNAGVQGFFSRIFGGNSEKALPPPTSNGNVNGGANGNQQSAPGVQSEEEAKKKKGLFGKIVGVFKGDGSKNDKTPPASSKSGDSGAPPQ
jgi:penicillin-binding protein 1B